MIEAALIWMAVVAGLVAAGWAIERLGGRNGGDPYECRHVHGVRCEECSCIPYATADVYMIVVDAWGEKGRAAE